MIRWIAILPMVAPAICAAGIPAAAYAAPPQTTAPPAAPASGEMPAWQTPMPDQVKALVFAWLEAEKVDAALLAKVRDAWADMSPKSNDDEILARLAATFAAIDGRAAKLVELCSQRRSRLSPPGEEWLREPGVPPLFANNLRLLYARWLVRESLFEEASEQLAGLEPSDVVAPASLLFYQGVVCHALLNKESGLKSIDALLQGADSSPKRYVAVARLMQDDLQNLDEESLDHIARRMSDIRRRLDLGRAGPKVRQVEDGVIQSLDKLIKKVEEQQEEQQSSEMADGIQSSSPAKDSYLRSGKGPGDVTKKSIGSASGWGDLPPKEREEALQQIGRDFPSHYREVIEQYFRRLATEDSPK